MSASIVAAEGAEKASSLPIPAEAFGLLALAALGLLLAVTFAFRSVGNRH
jgi:hypothetical protein